MDETPVLPDGVDAELWFECCHHQGARDYLLSTAWHTFPGRMSAWCSVRRIGFRVSKCDLPADLPTATRYWVQGFLTGNLPRQPDADDDDSPAIVVWKAHAERFLATGMWPPAIGTEQQRQWWADAQVLGQLGEVLADVPVPLVKVHLPSGLADEAAAAWVRGDDGEPPAYETAEQRVDRQRAADLARIGLAIETQGRRDGDSVEIDLSADILMAAIRASGD
jgi:hypothetical protein